MTWPSWSVKSPSSWLFAQQLVHSHNKGNIKGRQYWPFVREIHRWPVDFPHNGSVMRKTFSRRHHLKFYGTASQMIVPLSTEAVSIAEFCCMPKQSIEQTLDWSVKLNVRNVIVMQKCIWRTNKHNYYIITPFLTVFSTKSSIHHFIQTLVHTYYKTGHLNMFADLYLYFSRIFPQTNDLNREAKYQLQWYAANNASQTFTMYNICHEMCKPFLLVYVNSS